MNKAFLLLIIMIVSMTGLHAEEFNLYAPTVQMQWLQYCRHCRSTLDVTHLPAGALINCPSCRQVQKRLPKSMLQIKTMQICSGCGVGLSVQDMLPGTIVACPSCQQHQEVVASALTNINRQTARRRVIVPPAPGYDNHDASQAGITSHNSAKQDVGRQESLPSLNSIIDRRKALTELQKISQTVMPESKAPVPEVSEDDKSRALAKAVSESVDFAKRKVVPQPKKLPKLKAAPDAGISEVATKATTVKVAKTLPHASKGFGNYSEQNELTNRRVIAQVNGEAITADEQELRVNYLLDQKRRYLGKYAQTMEGRRELMSLKPSLKQEVLQQLIDEMVVVTAAQDEGVTPSDADVMQMIRRMRLGLDNIEVTDSMIARVRHDLILQKMQQLHSRTLAPRPSEVRDYYMRHKHKAEYLDIPMVQVRTVIVFDDRQGRARQESSRVLIQKAHDTIKAEGNFIAAVKKYSEGPFAAAGGIWQIREKNLVPVAALAVPIQRALKDNAVQIGSIFGPLKITNAWVIARVEKYQPGGSRSLKEVYQTVEKKLFQVKRKQAFAKYIRKKRAKADIRIY
jgi:parvulin-like peptidyl-prolyl isomerase